MKNLSLISCLVLTTLFLNKVSGQNQFLVNAESGLRLRESGSLEAKVVGAVPKGSLVENLSFFGPEDTIEGFIGNWVKIRYGEIEGMAFNAWLVPMEMETEEDADPDWCLLPTSSDCWALPNLKGFYVYGLFSSADSSFFEIRKVEPEYIMGGEVFGTDFRRIGFEEGTGEIRVKGESQPLLMFASRKEVAEGIIAGKAYGWDLKKKEAREGLFLGAGAVHGIYLEEGRTMYLKGRAVVEYRDTVAVPAYYLSYSPKSWSGSGQDHNLLRELVFSREGVWYREMNLLSAHQSPTILFAGDIDGDGKTDLLIESSNCSDSCSGRAAVNLLLSSCAKEDAFLGLAAWYIGDPCI